MMEQCQTKKDMQFLGLRVVYSEISKVDYSVQITASCLQIARVTCLNLSVYFWKVKRSSYM
jgi:hypothetical protein